MRVGRRIKTKMIRERPLSVLNDSSNTPNGRPASALPGPLVNGHPRPFADIPGGGRLPSFN